jgi:hypothetical protein
VRAKPAEVVTAIGPVVARLGTVALIDVADVTLKLAVARLNVTPVVPERPPPLIVTCVPTGPLLGEKPEMLGSTVNAVALVGVPPPVVTPIGPVVAPPARHASEAAPDQTRSSSPVASSLLPMRS